MQEEQNQMCENNQEKKQTNSEQEVVKKPFFTNKCKWIAFSIFFVLILGGIATGVVVTVIKSQKKSSVATLVINQRDDFTQQDEICVQHKTQNLTNCTQIHINTTRVTIDTNENNATSLVILQGLKLSQFQQADDGSRTYTDLTEQNNQIEAQIKNLLRILQESDNDNDFCYGIDKSECGDINQIPLLSVVTNQQTGNVEQIGVPSGVPDLALQPLVSNVVHIAPNVEEASNQTTPGNGRTLIEDSYYSNLYYIGQQAFLPKFEKIQGDDDTTIIKKSISLSQWMNNNKNGGIGLNILDNFDQLQESVFDKNNFLVSSHIRTYSLIDNSIQSSDPNDVTQQSQTQIDSDSNVITVQTRSDKDLSNALQEIKSKQTVNYYTAQDIQTKILQTKNGDQQDSDENQDYQEENTTPNNQDTVDTASQQLQNINGGNRILQDENADVSTSGDTSFVAKQSECYDTKFTEKRKLKEVTVLKQKIAIQSEFSGQTTGKDATGYIQTCITLNDFCLYLLQRDDFLFNGPKIKDIKKEESESSNLFKTTILLMGYPVELGADVNYSWSFKQSNIDTLNEKGIQESVSAQLSVTAYGEINLLAIIKIQAGVEGNIFKGSLVGAVRFGFDNQKGLIQFNRYLVSIDFQLEILTIDLYAKFSTVIIRFEKRCVGRKWWKVCIWLPIPDDSEWKDIYRVSFQIVKVAELKRLFELKSKCY